METCKRLLPHATFGSTRTLLDLLMSHLNVQDEQNVVLKATPVCMS